MTTPRALSDEELNSCLFRLSPSIVEKLRAHISFLNTRVEALKSENEKLKAVCENKTILLRAVRYSMDREVPFPSLEKITDAINDGTNGYETELSTLRQLCEDQNKAITANHKWHEEYDEYGGYGDSDLCEQNCKALAKYNSMKGERGES